MRLGIFGGSFNPPHVGHLRLAIEMREALDLDRVDLVPVSAPPHKAASGLLPYGLRRHILQAAVSRVQGLDVSELEAVLSEPSFTFRTLAAYREILPEAEVHFLLGVGDLLDFPKWHRGLELPRVANLAVAPRQGGGLPEVASFVAEYWPDAVRDDVPANDGSGRMRASWRFNGEEGVTRLTLVPVTRIDVSATAVRERFMAGNSVAFLVPREAIAILAEHADQVLECWGTDACAPVGV